MVRRMFPTDAKVWAQDIFGGCELGDARRTKRLIDMGERLARQAGASMAACCSGDPAAQLGSYRFLRNAAVSAKEIAEGGFTAVGRHAREHRRLLALEDTTTLSYRHAVAAELGMIGTDAAATSRGYLVHSVLLVDAHSERTLGLIEQQYWRRDPAGHGKKHARKQRPYIDKESVKWQRASEHVAQRLGPSMAQVIAVCDRESDVYDYLQYKRAQQQRFVLRARVDRRVEGHVGSLFTTLEEHARVVGHKSVSIAQRSGRKARVAQLVLQAATVALRAPARTGRGGQTLSVNVVLAQEVDAPEGVTPLCWRLLTSEPIDDLDAVRRVVRDYELRWRIEEYHKAWKSGVGVERQRLQSAPNLERMLVITAFVAVRLLQLREAVQAAPSVEAPTVPESTSLSQDEWRMLWASTERSAPPTHAPSASWAYRALAKLGGFTDTKGTGRPGWATLWQGWFRLQERLEGYRLSQQTSAEM
ncbi:MAG: IS4 family transposase [Pseudomonadota bacterium]|nr:IS4 family transposase [Pseudomonadota bacterium]